MESKPRQSDLTGRPTKLKRDLIEENKFQCLFWGQYKFNKCSTPATYIGKTHYKLFIQSNVTKKFFLNSVYRDRETHKYYIIIKVKTKSSYSSDA